MAFHSFTKLPSELRQLIWRLALPEDTQEVCLVKAENLKYTNRDAAAVEPMIVYTAFPALMHVSRESRDCVLHHSDVQFRREPAEGLSVPYRPFRPELDIHYWGKDVAPSITASARYYGDFGEWIRHVRHVALPSSRSFEGAFMSECFVSCCDQLETVTVVLADSTDNNKTLDQFEEPRGRCKLRDIPIDGNTVLDIDHWGGGQPDDIVKLDEFIDAVRTRLEECADSLVRLEPVEEQRCKSWNVERSSFEALTFKIATFIEWTAGEWREQCGQRKLPRGLGS